MSWKADCDLVRHWLASTSCPMLAAKEDGSILFANEAFESLLGYTSPELIGGNLKWQDLTSDRGDERAEEELSNDLFEGKRDSYSMIKSLSQKQGIPVRVLSHVMRWPASGDFECYLISIIPLEADLDSIMDSVSDVRTQMYDLIRHITKPQPSVLDRALVWANENQMKASIIACVALGMLFGESFLVVLSRVLSVLHGNPEAPPAE